jgi:hypothetical protein
MVCETRVCTLKISPLDKKFVLNLMCTVYTVPVYIAASISGFSYSFSNKLLLFGFKLNYVRERFCTSYLVTRITAITVTNFRNYQFCPYIVHKKFAIANFLRIRGMLARFNVC